MKKRFLFLSAVVIAFVAMLTPIHAADEIAVSINGVNVVFADQPPVIVDGRTLVPVRGVFEQLGFYVEWDEPQVTLTRDDFVVLLTVGSAVFTTNGETHALDVPAQIINNRTMLPIRAVLESVGYYVGWNEATRTVLISADGSIVLEPSPYDLFADVLRKYSGYDLPAKYAFFDINSDGVAELFVYIPDHYGHTERLYTYAAGEAHRVGGFALRAALSSIDAQGYLYIEEHGGWDTGRLSIGRLSDDNTSLIWVEGWRHSMGEFEHTVGDVTRSISEQEWENATSAARAGTNWWLQGTPLSRPGFDWRPVGFAVAPVETPVETPIQTPTPSSVIVAATAFRQILTEQNQLAAAYPLIFDGGLPRGWNGIELVNFHDLTGDGVPEILLLRPINDTDAELWIFTHTGARILAVPINGHVAGFGGDRMSFEVRATANGDILLQSTAPPGHFSTWTAMFSLTADGAFAPTGGVLYYVPNFDPWSDDLGNAYDIPVGVAFVSRANGEWSWRGNSPGTGTANEHWIGALTHGRLVSELMEQATATLMRNARTEWEGARRTEIPAAGMTFDEALRHLDTLISAG